MDKSGEAISTLTVAVGDSRGVSCIFQSCTPTMARLDNKINDNDPTPQLLDRDVNPSSNHKDKELSLLLWIGWFCSKTGS